MSVVPETHAALLDLVRVVDDNPDVFEADLRSRGAALGERLRLNGTGMSFQPGEAGLAVDLADAACKAVVAGKINVGSEALMRICERIVFDDELCQAFIRPPGVGGASS